MATRRKVAIVLSGGGARAAYQVGVLRAIAEQRGARTASPFNIVTGTSAGAINALALAAGAQDFRGATKRLCSVWSNLYAKDIYRTEASSLAGSGGRWLVSFVPIWRHRRPASLLDNAPLEAFLRRLLPVGAVRNAIDTGALEALAITAMSYRSGLSVTFCETRPDVELWSRSPRLGLNATSGVTHLRGSSAIPIVCPPAAIDGDYYADASVRQVAPPSPALPLGAESILVVSAARGTVPPYAPPSAAPP